MYGIPDDPIISCMERTGLPPWMLDDTGYFDDEEEYADEEDEDDG